MSVQIHREGAGVAPSSPLAISAGQRIHFQDLSVRYGATTVLQDFTLTVEPGEIVALLGPSGSGKTTALRAVAGFVTPSGGQVFIGDRDVTHIAPNARNIGMVVQNYALFPHMSVAENVAFGLRARREGRRLIADRVAESLEMVGMSAYAHRMPRALSGGQQQRVAIARALAIRPSVLLLDEPLSALDAQIRRQMVEEIARLHRDLPDLTILYVTHDQHEALTLADRIAIMRDGRLSALASARSLYRRPPNRFAAEFLGRANVVAGRITARHDATRLAEVSVAGQVLVGTNIHDLPLGASALICLRPHQLTLSPARIEAAAVTGRVTHVDWQGASETLTLALGCAAAAPHDTAAAELRATVAPGPDTPEVGAPLTLHYDPQEATILPEAEHG